MSLISPSFSPPPGDRLLHSAKAALLTRLYNLNIPADDVASAIAVMTGQSQHLRPGSINEGVLLHRLSNGNVLSQDIAVIVNAMRNNGYDAHRGCIDIRYQKWGAI